MVNQAVLIRTVLGLPEREMVEDTSHEEGELVARGGRGDEGRGGERMEGRGGEGRGKEGKEGDSMVSQTFIIWTVVGLPEWDVI